MRYFSFHVYDPKDIHNGRVETLSEADILKQFYPIWREKMIRKYGERKVDHDFTYHDCIQDWCTENGAWESDL